MFADPAVITINAIARNLVRINQDKYSSEYFLRSSTDEYRMYIRNTTRTDRSTGAVWDRHNVELIHTVFPVAPATLSVIRRTYVVFENQVGDTTQDPINTALGLFAFLTQGKLAQLVNRES